MTTWSRLAFVALMTAVMVVVVLAWLWTPALLDAQSGPSIRHVDQVLDVHGERWLLGPP